VKGRKAGTDNNEFIYAFLSSQYLRQTITFLMLKPGKDVYSLEKVLLVFGSTSQSAHTARASSRSSTSSWAV